METQLQKPKIIFVYNADRGVFNLVSDIAHKIFSPQTYSCNLCAITYSNLGMKKEWQEILEDGRKRQNNPQVIVNVIFTLPNRYSMAEFAK